MGEGTKVKDTRTVAEIAMEIAAAAPEQAGLVASLIRVTAANASLSTIRAVIGSESLKAMPNSLAADVINHAIDQALKGVVWEIVPFASLVEVVRGEDATQ